MKKSVFLNTPRTQVKHSILQLAVEETHNGRLDGNAGAFLVLGKDTAEVLKATRGKYSDELCFIATFNNKLNVSIDLNYHFKLNT
jgi:hypothetical protein